MKELYLNAEMDVVKFTIEDVIATSGAVDNTTAATQATPPRGENEGEAGSEFPE